LDPSAFSFSFSRRERKEKDVSLAMFLQCKSKDFSFVHVMSYINNKTPTANLFYSQFAVGPRSLFSQMYKPAFTHDSAISYFR